MQKFKKKLRILSAAHEAADAFEASGLAVTWNAAFSLPALGSPTMDPTPALELLNKRNALRNRNRDLSDLTAESPPPPRTKRRVHAPSLPVTSPHVMPQSPKIQLGRKLSLGRKYPQVVRRAKIHLSPETQFFIWVRHKLSFWKKRDRV